MKLSVTVRGNILYIGEIRVAFSYNIETIIFFDDQIIVLLNIPTNCNETDNVYSVNFNGDIMWRIENVKIKFPKFNLMPYVGIGIKDERLWAYDFMGREFIINEHTGEIEKFVRARRF